MDEKIRVLSLDGGGSHAGIMARALGAIYEPDMPGREIVKKFDFIAGNSAGSIVMTELCCNYTPLEIAALYDDPASTRKLYSPKWYAFIPFVRALPFIALYSSTGKHKVLRDLFDSKQEGASKIPMKDWPSMMGCSKTNLLVSAFDYDKRRATFFRSNLASLAGSSSPANDVPLVDAVHASTNAPITYFDKPALVGGRRYWDGALGGYNNPVLAAVVEALANRPHEADQIRVLSLGTRAEALPQPPAKGAEPPWGEPRPSTCTIEAIKRASSAVLDEPPDVASFHAYLALRQPLPQKPMTVANGNVVRLCPLLRPHWNARAGRWEPLTGITAEEFKAMTRLRSDAMKADEIATIRKIADRWIAGDIPNQPIRRGEHSFCDIGHDTFAEAAAHWHRIS